MAIAGVGFFAVAWIYEKQNTRSHGIDPLILSVLGVLFIIIIIILLYIAHSCTWPSEKVLIGLKKVLNHHFLSIFIDFTF